MRQIKDIEPRELVERIRANVPEELRERPQWTLWKIGNDRKIPLSVFGGYASCSDSSTWGTFDHAAAVFFRNTKVCRGFNMATGSGLGGLDLDGVVREDGTLPEPQIGGLVLGLGHSRRIPEAVSWAAGLGGTAVA